MKHFDLSPLHRPNPMLLIALVGPAGAGKTTLARNLIQRNPAIQVGAEIELRKLEQAPRLLRSLPAILPIGLQARRAGGRLTWNEIKYLLYLDGWIHALRHQASAERPVVLVDHGPVFKLAALHAFGPGVFRDGTLDDWWKRTLDSWGSVLNYIIWLDAPDVVLETRINSRRQGHVVKGRSAAEVSNFLEKYRRSYDQLISRLASDRGPVVFRYDTSQTTIGQITEEVLALCNTRLMEGQHEGSGLGIPLAPGAGQ